MLRPLKLGQAQKGLIASLLSLALITAIFGGQSLREPSANNQTTQSAKEHRTPKVPEEPTNLSDWFLVVLNFFLVCSTLLLWRANNRSAAISERALGELERPWIFVELSKDLLGNPDDDIEGPYALFDITNHGRGPAIIEEFHGEISSNDLRPVAPMLRDEFHGIIGPGKAMERCKIYCPAGFTYDASVDPAYGTSFPVPLPAEKGWEVFLRILIHYLDIAGSGHDSAFCWRYDRGVCRWVKFEEEPSGKTYNYLT
jgi:hypothetical protein